jgi:hypothetical protein
MQVDEKRACPSCGAENGPDADFCWKCYARFVPPPPPPGRPGQAAWGRMPPPGSTFQPSPITEPTRGSRGSSVAKIVGGVVVAALVAFAVHTFFGADVHLPDAVAGRPRMSTDDIESFEKDMQDLGSRNDLTVDAGAYGSGVQPEFLVLLVHGKSIESTDALFDEFVGGLEQSGATVDRTGGLAEAHDGADYRCVPVTGNRVTAAACIWREDGSVGIVLDLTEGVKAAEATTWQVHDDATG